MSSMPLMIDLTNKQIVIVGGGKVATRRASTLIEYCPNVHIVSPSITTDLHKLVKEQRVMWHEKCFEPQDIKHADIVVLATNQPDVNDDVKASLPEGTLLNHAAHAQEGDVTFPSVLRRGKLTISVSTNGASPKLGRQILSTLSDMYDERYETYIDFLYQSRKMIKDSTIEPSRKQSLLQHLLSEDYLDEEKQHEFMRWLQSQV
ncbi:NAD(P)-binding protein [Staphylococcus taiwanensis]|nr:NAD(P)-binding protein [Staphylococcus taiwanensis]